MPEAVSLEARCSRFVEATDRFPEMAIPRAYRGLPESIPDRMRSQLTSAFLSAVTASSALWQLSSWKAVIGRSPLRRAAPSPLPLPDCPSENRM